MSDRNGPAADGRAAYPFDLVSTAALPDGIPLLIRPVRPDDEPAFHAAFAKLDPLDIRLRFFAPMRVLSHDLAARLTGVDYIHEMALIAIEPQIAALVGVVRLHAAEDFRRAEFALIVLSALKGRGIGRLLMQHLIAYARTRGIGALEGDVLRENKRMLALVEDLGFAYLPRSPEPMAVRVRLELG